jgi:hypothetical protein
MVLRQQAIGLLAHLAWSTENAMSTPLIVVSTFRVKEGKLGDLSRYYEKIMGIVKANEPRVILFYAFLNEERTEMTSIQVHPNTASMDFHMQVMRDNWDSSFSEYSQLLEVIRGEYYGTAPESALEMDRQNDWATIVKPIPVAGFVRSAAG